MKRPFLIVLLLLLCINAENTFAQDLEAGFQSPPPEARTRCFWWWLSGNVTKEAITRDLEEMKAKGMGGALIFDAGSSAYRTVKEIPAGPMFGSPAWQKLFLHALREAERLDLELGLNIQSGWNLGGPKVSHDEAAKQLTWSVLRVQGPATISEILPQPKAREGYYRDIALLSYRMKAAQVQNNPPEIEARSSENKDLGAARAIDGDPATYWVSAAPPSKGSLQWLTLTFPEAVTVNAVEVLGRPNYGPKELVLLAQRDKGAFNAVTHLSLKNKQTGKAQFRPVTSRQFRIEIHSSYDRGAVTDTPRNTQVAEWRLLDAQERNLVTMARPGIAQLYEKSGFRELGGSAPDCRPLLESGPVVPGEEDCAVADILRLDHLVDIEGNLHWDVPEGEWQLLRFGYTLTGAHVSTASGKWQGAVLDYMSTPALEAYWDRNVQPLLDAAGPLAGSAWQWLHTDSWECGGMNWSPDFAAHFKALRGYDPIPYLPVIAEKIVENRDVSNRFLADFRKTIGDCVADQHYKVFQEKAHMAGMKIHPESGGPHAGPIDGLKFLGRSDMPMGEFWSPSPHRPTPERRFFVKQAASAAHIYGGNRVAAEGFTTIGPHWEDSLWRHAKPAFDHEACAGLNLTYLHTFTCSPKEMGLPGQEYFAGTHFNPNVTWWEQAGAVIDYLNRCHYLLQQGQFVADVCYYYGDHIPNIVQRKEADPAGLLPGYDYDVINEEILLTRMTVEEGMLVLPQGLRYRILVLPDHKILSLPALRKIQHLVDQGATVLGDKAVRTASLTGYPASEAEFQTITAALWDGGSVLQGLTAREALKQAGIAADFQVVDSDTTQVNYIHRKTDTADIYFIANERDKAVRFTGAFRITGKQPELWDPLRGVVRPALAFQQTKHNTQIPLSLPPYGSQFVVFQDAIPPAATGNATTNYPLISEVMTLEEDWTVSFDPTWGGPESISLSLGSWTDADDPDICYYSGTATYTQSIVIAPGVLHEGVKLHLDLGEVREMASVQVNGQSMGVLWTPPFRIDITPALKANSSNLLEIEVVNNWPNRLIGDAALPPAKRFTKTNVTSFKADMPLTPSGLLGPVRILSAEKP